MEIEGDTFYLLNTEKSKFIFNTEQEAIGKLKKIATGGRPDPDKTMIFEVITSGEEWSIKQVPWSKIAIQLMEEG